MAETQQSQQRLQNLGRLGEMKKQEKKLRYAIDGLVSNISDLFSPRDYSLSYTSRIDIGRLEAHTQDLKDRVLELRRLQAEIAEMRKELGMDENEV